MTVNEIYQLDIHTQWMYVVYAFTLRKKSCHHKNVIRHTVTNLYTFDEWVDWLKEEI